MQPTKKPFIAKFIMVAACLYAAFTVIVIVSILVASVQIANGDAGPFMQGFYEGATGMTSPLDVQQQGYIIGTFMLPFIAAIFAFVSLYKRSRKLRIAAIVLFALLFLSSVGQGSFSLGTLFFAIMLSLKPVGRYVFTTQTPKA